MQKMIKHVSQSEYKAVDLETYNEILIAKDISALTHSNDKDDRDIGELLLINDIVRYKVAWYGNLVKDFIIFLRLHHPFFSMFYGHNQHVISKRARIIIFVTNVILQFANLCLLSDVLNFPSDTETEDCNNKSSSDTSNSITKSFIRIIFSIVFALLGLICNVSLYIAASCQCVEFSKRKALRWTCNNIFGNCCSCCVFVAVLLWALLCGLAFFDKVSNDLKGCARSEFDNVLFVFFVTLISGLYQTYFIFYTFVDILIFYPKWKQQTGQKNLNLIDYKNICCDACYQHLTKRDTPSKLVQLHGNSKPDHEHKVQQAQTEIKQNSSIKLVNRSINVTEEYLQQRAKEYQNWKIKMELISQNGEYQEQHSCLYYFCCCMYCCCCLSCFCLSMCVKYISKRKDAKTDGGKPTKDIIDDYGNVIGKSKKEFAITYYEFQLFEKNKNLDGAIQRRASGIAKGINANIETFYKSSSVGCQPINKSAISSVVDQGNSQDLIVHTRNRL